MDDWHIDDNCIDRCRYYKEYQIPICETCFRKAFKKCFDGDEDTQVLKLCGLIKTKREKLRNTRSSHLKDDFMDCIMTTYVQQISSKNKPHILKSLIEIGGNVNGEDNDYCESWYDPERDRTPLMVAVSSNDLELTKWLVEQDADIDKTYCYSLNEDDFSDDEDDDGDDDDEDDDDDDDDDEEDDDDDDDDDKPPFSLPPGYPINKDETALTIALEQNNLDIARYLIKNGADLKAMYNNVGTILHAAIVQKNLEFVHLIMEYADATLLNEHYRNHSSKYADIADETPLYLAIAGKQEAVVKALIAKGVDVNCTYTDTDNMKILAESLSNDTIQGPETCPILLKAMFSTPEIVQILLEAGADPTIKTSAGGAIQLPKPDNLRKLLAWPGVDVNEYSDGNGPSICLATLCEPDQHENHCPHHHETMQLLFEMGALPNYPPLDGYHAPPLSNAFFASCCSKCMDICLEHGADGPRVLCYIPSVKNLIKDPKLYRKLALTLPQAVLPVLRCFVCKRLKETLEENEEEDKRREIVEILDNVQTVFSLQHQARVKARKCLEGANFKAKVLSLGLTPAATDLLLFKDLADD